MDKIAARPLLKSLTSRPGVYRMMDADGKAIYVGKAKNLKNRIGSYFRDTQESAKTRAMVKHTAAIDVTVTDTEADALLLESNLIKEFKPRYNIVFRDDKSYPYLYLSLDHAFPRLSFYRGARKGKGRYFGPYPSAGAARRSLNLVQKLFKLRQCDDSFFNNRQRPCLQFQIKRCSAPCVDYIEKENYARDIKLASLFLEGKNDQVITALHAPMQQASTALDFEKAARYRDQIAMLRQFQESQHIVADTGESDVIACALEHGQACVQLFCIRGGRNLGNRSYYPRVNLELDAASIIETFIKQYYIYGTVDNVPADIYVSHRPGDGKLLEDILCKKLGRTIHIRDRARGGRAGWIKMALDNARLSLNQRRALNLKYTERLEELREFLQRDDPITRIECFDISHTGGDVTVASCIVFGSEGPIKSDYRRFNIEGIAAADDYAAISQAISRRYTRVKKEEGRLPDLLLIDGGKGQVGQARDILKELQLEEGITLLGIAKGPSRKPGLETLVLSDGKSQLRLQADSSMLHLLQEVRDEAHRFAITGHRQRRRKKQNKSPLQEIAGIGSKRRRQLIHHFGGMQGVLKASADELAKVPGINKNLARKIYDTLHDR
jgi:excinuclease ABC subunit C